MLTTGTAFADFSLHPMLLKSLEMNQFTEPTPIQAQAIPIALSGRDVIACSQTGSGKTAAFTIPMLQKLAGDETSQALILAPTRELALQIFQVTSKFSRDLRIRGALLIGGESFIRQTQALRQDARYVVATPGRLVDHMQQGTISLKNVNLLVLDEFDRMLDMGFAPQLEAIVEGLSAERQTLLFSATMAADLERKVKQYTRDAERISIGSRGETASTVVEKNIDVKLINKGDFLFNELKELSGRILIFTRTQQRVDRVANALEKEGFEVARLHGGRNMKQRQAAMRVFKMGKVPIMVATDIAGRGLDVDDIQTVINYDLPATREDYIHRVGRAGRYGKSGTAINFCLPEDRFLLRKLKITSKGGDDAAPQQERRSAHAPLGSRRPRQDYGRREQRYGDSRPQGGEGRRTDSRFGDSRRDESRRSEPRFGGARRDDGRRSEGRFGESRQRSDSRDDQGSSYPRRSKPYRPFKRDDSATFNQ